MKTIFTVTMCLCMLSAYAFQPDDSLVKKSVEKMKGVAELWKTSGFDDTMMCSFYNRKFNRRPVYMHVGTLPPGSEFDFVAAKEGDILGPYAFGNCVALYKFVDRADRPDSVRFSQILVTYKGATQAEPYVSRSKEDARKRADSLCFELRTGKIFMDEIMVMESDDVSGLLLNHGEYGWMTRESEYPQTVIDAAFETPPGSFVIAESERGYHVISVDSNSIMWDCFRAWEIKWCIDTCYDFKGQPMVAAAMFPGGEAAMTAFLQSNKSAYDSLDVAGQFDYPVLVVFDVLPDGSIGNVGVFRQSWVTPGIVRDIARLVKSMPKWKPAQSCNGPVREEQSVVIYL